MNQDQKRMPEIARHEEWLARFLPAKDSGLNESLKLRLQVEFAEQWLAAGPLGHAEEPPIPQSLRKAVRTAVADAAGLKVKTWKWLPAAGLGIAAVLVCSIVLFQSGPEQVVQPDFDSDVDAFAYDSQEEEFDDELDDALAQLEDLFASRDDTEWDDVWDGL